MYVERILSLNDGWSILSTQKATEWEEAQSALSLIDDSFILLGIEAAAQAIIDAAGISSDEIADGSFLPYFLYNIYNSYLESRYEWTETLSTAKDSVRSQMAPKAIKNRISVSMIEADAMQTEDFLTSLYITIPYYHNSGIIDISVILIPTMDAINHIISLGAKPSQIAKIPTEEICRAQLAKFGLSHIQTPIVLAFFSPIASEKITIEELAPLKVSGHTIERTIEFAPEFYQAGVSLLSYFGEVLRQKAPETKAKVRIEQDGRLVRLHIESSAGEIETIEKELDQYALVIGEQALPSSLFDNQVYIMQLEHKLDVAKLELKQAHNTLSLLRDLHSQQISNLEQQLASLRELVSGQLLYGKTLKLSNRQASSHEKMQKSLLSKLDTLFKGLHQDSNDNQQLIEALDTLQYNLSAGIATIAIEHKLEEALSTITEQNPKFISRIHIELDNASYKAPAGSAIDWSLKWIQQYQ